MLSFEVNQRDIDPRWGGRVKGRKQVFAMHLGQSSRLLGYVQVQIGSQTYALPVQAVHFERDRASSRPAGGFFTEESGEYGIIVDGDASEGDMQAQIKKASAEAVRFISQKLLN